MNLFIEALNQYVQDAQGAPMATLEGICQLTAKYFGANIHIKGQDGDLIRIPHLPFTEANAENILQAPLSTNSIIFATITISRPTPFSQEDALIFTIIQPLCTLLMRQQNALAVGDLSRRRGAVRNLINTLSFSELEAAVQIMKSLEGNKQEGLLVAGHIADRMGFARSVVTAALKKLEGASLVETRSLGMKGTYIKVREPLLIEELGKF